MANSEESAESAEDSAKTRELFELPVVQPANNSIVSRALASDEKTVARVLAGKTGEFRQLVERYQRPVFRFVRNLIREEHDAEDITQGVFLSAFDNLATFNASRAGWHSLLVNLCGGAARGRILACCFWLVSCRFTTLIASNHGHPYSMTTRDGITPDFRLANAE